MSYISCVNALLVMIVTAFTRLLVVCALRPPPPTFSPFVLLFSISLPRYAHPDRVLTKFARIKLVKYTRLARSWVNLMNPGYVASCLSHHTRRAQSVKC